MTNPTPHGQVPEALQLADAIDPLTRKGLDNLTCGVAAAELRRLHAENEALRAAHVQNPAKNEHVADDVSKNGAELNMSTQQPVPSAAAAVGQEPPGMHALMCVISSLRDTAHFSDEEGDVTDDLRTLRDWALAQAAAPQPSPTPQADNQPAPAGAIDQDGEAFRAAAHLGLTLRFYGGCAQSGMPGTPSAYEVVAGGDRAAAMREAVQRAVAVIENGGESQPPAPAATADVLQVFIEKKGRVRIFIYDDELHSTLTHTRRQSSAR